MKKIPFVDLKRQYKSIKSEVDGVLMDCLTNTAFVGGERVKQFEEDFSSLIGVKYVVGCANGTDSLEMLLKGLGVQSGDEVIVPAVSWFSTSEAVSAVGATPVFVDVDEDLLINLDLIEEKINEKTKVVIPVHLYGKPVNMSKLMHIARKNNLKVLEDCAQAHLAEWEGRKVGTWGDCGSFSFYPGKNLGAYGDAGAMVTNNQELANTVRMIANHGQLVKHDHIIEGRNSRLDAIQASVLSLKINSIEFWTNERIKHAEYYSKHLSNQHISVPTLEENERHVFHLYVVKTKQRDRLMEYLKERQIGCAIHYPVALPFLKPYSHRNFSPSDYPVAAKITSEILSIPMFPELTKEETEYVVNVLNEFG